MNHSPTLNSEAIQYAGFWRRFVALVIDMCLVSICVFPLIVALDFVFPDKIIVTTPFDLFSEERVLEVEKSTAPNADGSVTAIETKIVQKTYLNKWTYTYRVVEKSMAGETRSETQLIDPISKQDIRKTTSDNLELIALMIYLSLMEGSRYQASLGKIALGLKTTDKEGRRLTIVRAAGRNISKLLSVFTLFIGFMMAGWTNKKQALHDMVSGCLVIRG